MDPVLDSGSIDIPMPNLNINSINIRIITFNSTLCNPNKFLFTCIVVASAMILLKCKSIRFDYIEIARVCPTCRAGNMTTLTAIVVIRENIQIGCLLGFPSV